MWFILTIVGLKRLFKRLWIVGIAATVVFTFLAARGLFVEAPGLLWINIAIAFIVVGIITVLAIHVGLLATVLAFGIDVRAHRNAMELRHERVVLPAVGARLLGDGRRCRFRRLRSAFRYQSLDSITGRTAGTGLVKRFRRPVPLEPGCGRWGRDRIPWHILMVRGQASCKVTAEACPRIFGGECVLRRARLFFPSPTPHLDSNRRATEPERVADLVHKKSFVGKMEGRRYVGEEHEGGRRDAGLRRIEHAHLSPPGAGRRVHGRDGLNESIQLGVSARVSGARRPRGRSPPAASGCAPRWPPRCAGRWRSRETSAAGAALRRTP